MMKSRMRVGLVGFGRIAESAHRPAWLALPGVDVVAVADCCRERREAAAEQVVGVRTYLSCQEMLETERLDCLDICTPPYDHAPSIVAACEHRVQRIVCEKPLTTTPEGLQAIEDAQARSGCQVYTVNSWLQSDLHRLVRMVLEAGTIGVVEAVTLRTFRPDCAIGVACWEPRWRTNPVYAGGGIVLDHGWHQLYLVARWIGTDPVEVEARLQTVQARHAPVEDKAVIDLGFSSAKGRIELSWAAPGRSNDGEIRGTRGTVVIGDEGLIVRTEGGDTSHAYGERLSDSSYHPDWFSALFARVLADRSGRVAQANRQEAAMLLRTLFSAYRAAAAREKSVTEDLPLHRQEGLVTADALRRRS
jgi:predicted dehydrogenase